jgi:hypothetical protein
MTDKEIKRIISDSQSGEYKVCAWGAGYIGRNSGYKMLKDLAIKIDFYCDNNSELYGSEIIEGIKCINPKDMPIDTICFILINTFDSAGIVKQLSKYHLKYIVPLMALCDYMSKRNFECIIKNQLAVYTCIVGGYDEVQEPDELIPNCDYYLISDVEKKNSVYKFININNFAECKELDNTRKNRYCKINAHKIFPNYKYSIYHDGNVSINKNILNYMTEFPITKIIGLARTSYKSIYAEAYRGMINKRDEEERFRKQVDKYWNEGMPEDFGLIDPTFMIRQHNHPVCKKIMEDWWNEVLDFSRRDMVSLPYVLWKNGYTADDVAVCSKEADEWHGEGWIYRGHKIKINK